MAIPFLPNNSDESTTTEEQLMYQLYVTLHNALRSRNAHHPSRNRELCEFLKYVHRRCERFLKRLIARNVSLRYMRSGRLPIYNEREE